MSKQFPILVKHDKLFENIKMKKKSSWHIFISSKGKSTIYKGNSLSKNPPKSSQPVIKRVELVNVTIL